MKAFTESQVDGLVLAGAMHMTPALASAMRHIPTVVAGNHEFEPGRDGLRRSRSRRLGQGSPAGARPPEDHPHQQPRHRHLPDPTPGPRGSHAFPRTVQAHHSGVVRHHRRRSFAATERLLTGPGPHPTTFFVGNDLTALGVLALARSRRITIPEELAIATIDVTWPAAPPSPWPQ